MLLNKNKQNVKQGKEHKRKKTASKQNGSLALIAGLLVMSTKDLIARAGSLNDEAG
jgi:hypothetical protein